MGVPRLLVVDDDATLLKLLRRYLERLGHEVETATDPHDALARYSAEPARYHLVIVDLTLPGMNGEELLERMRRIDPDLRALITSGYVYEPQLPEVGFLQKPFLPEVLAKAVELALKQG